ncbi:transglycosylase domain-containing protein [Marinicauda salina]|uniref:transglycosylase domain-containing protein n=1 Tax=Marinicauda salina TaxID=2135793 RepID=UPI001E584FF2|nr:PBP1A family penicillin-binding protein [Marinicauda salina]
MARRLPAIIGGVVLLGLVAALTGAAVFWHWAFSDLPAPPESAEILWETRREPALTVLDRDGEVLSVRGPRYGEIVRLEELPSYVPQAFMAIEDQRFYSHDGVDWRSMLRALVVNVRARDTLQGGSTITMQLVKNLILSPERTIRRKLQEMRLAMQLENRLTKDEILELYINRIYLGEQAYGIEAAAQRYFDKSARELTLQEAAILAALPKAPSRLAPTVNLEAAQARASQVLRDMMEAGYVDGMTYLTAVNTQAAPTADALETIDPNRYGHIFDFVAAEAERLLGEEEAAPDLVIETTIDRDLQRAADDAVETVLAEEGEAVDAGEGALVALELDGAVRAMVGGRDYAESQFNRATQALRQPGSAFKPIVFAAAFEAGMEPYTAFEDAPIEIEGWSPENYGGGYRGRITIADALKRSINTVAAQAGLAAGPELVAEMAERLGITTEMSPHAAITLGAEEVKLIDLTGAYTVFANDGRRRPPWIISEIRNSRGEVLYRHESERGAQVIPREDARAMSTLLQAVIEEGTGRRARLPGRQAAGKTGTSQNSRDAWFVGYTAQLAAGVWVGNDDDAPMDDVTGGELPAQIWRTFMTAAHEGVEPEPLSAPAPRRRTEREESLAAFYSALSASFGDVLEASDEALESSSFEEELDPAPVEG